MKSLIEILPSFKKFISQMNEAKIIENVTVMKVNFTLMSAVSEVEADMNKMGRPTIKVVKGKDKNTFIAIEGSHRLQAAYNLKIVPYLKVMKPTDSIEDFPKTEKDEIIKELKIVGRTLVVKDFV